MRAGFLLLIFGIALPAASAQELTWDNFENQRDTILPDEAELTWQKIPWRTTFWEAVLEAQGKEKPILLWTMNGHPFAHT